MNIQELVKNHVRKSVVALVAVCGLGYYGYESYDYDPIDETLRSTNVGDDVRVYLPVNGFKQFKGKALVNDISYSDAVADGDLTDLHTVVLPGETNPQSLMGKTLKVQGKVTEYAGRKQITATKYEAE